MDNFVVRRQAPPERGTQGRSIRWDMRVEQVRLNAPHWCIIGQWNNCNSNAYSWKKYLSKRFPDIEFDAYTNKNKKEAKLYARVRVKVESPDGQ